MTLLRSPPHSPLRSPLYDPTVGPFSDSTLYLRPVANRTKQPFINTHGSDGTNTQGKFLSRHKVSPGGCAANSLKLVYCNRTREAAAFSTITVAARMRYPAGSGSWVSAAFSAAGNVAITSGGNDVTSDALANPAMTAGTYFDVETYITVALAGDKWPTLDGISLASASGEGSLLSTSDISAQTPTPSNTTEFYGPIAILGQSTATRAIAVFGDSIANGAADTLTLDKTGYIQRTFGDSYPMLMLASSAEKISDFVGAHTQRMAQLAASGITDIVFAFGTNDVAAGDSYATIRGNLLSVLALLAAQGKAITICPILVKTGGDINTPATGFTVGGIADQINTFITGDPGLISKFWDTRTAWQDVSNHILSATYTDDFLHPNAVGNAAIATGAPAASTLIASSVPARPVAPAFVTSNFLYFRANSLNALADAAAITTWVDSIGGVVTATWAGEQPTLKKNITANGGSVVRFSIAGTGLQKLVIPHAAAVDNIFNTSQFGAIYTIAKFASAGGNGTGRLWTKGVGETESLTSATNLRTTVDFNTVDIPLNGTVAASTWYVRQSYMNASNAGTLLQNSLNASTSTGTGSTTHIDNSASDFIIGNHDSLARGWDGDIAGIAMFNTHIVATADQLWVAQAYFRADSGVTII